MRTYIFFIFIVVLLLTTSFTRKSSRCYINIISKTRSKVIVDSAYLLIGNKIIYQEKIGEELKFNNHETISFENKKIIEEMKNKDMKLFVKIIYSKGNTKQEIKKGINENLYLKVGKVKIK